MGRLVFLVAGVVGGALGVRRMARAAHAYTPAGLGERVERWSQEARGFAADVRAGMAERELELRVALEVEAGSMDAQTAKDLLEDPTAPRR